jgi:hypothetical protein
MTMGERKSLQKLICVLRRLWIHCGMAPDAGISNRTYMLLLYVVAGFHVTHVSGAGKGKVTARRERSINCWFL